MAGINYIYQFGGSAVPPFIQTDAEYDADAMRTAGWQPGIVRQEFLNKVDRQGNSIAAGIGQFMADNESGVVDVTDDLTPNEMSDIFVDALNNVPLITQPQFDNTQKSATTAFVQRALGSLSSSVQHAANATLTDADIGKVISPTNASLAFELPLVAGLPDGVKSYFNGNTNGCVIAGQGADVIVAGTSGVIAAVSLKANDQAEFTVINGVWNLTGGEAHQAVSSSFEASLTTNGHEILPSGRIMQWGTTAVNVSTGLPPINLITLPIPWPNSFLSGSVSLVEGNIGSYAGMGIGGYSNSQIAIQVYSLGTSIGVYWTAIGH